MSFTFSVIPGQVIEDIISNDWRHAVESVRLAYLAHAAGESVNPNSYFLRFPDKPSARIIALPAYLGGDIGVSGIKWIASYPENIRQGFPRASAVLILNSYETGYPFACLESSIISATRTSASAVLAADHLVPERDTRTIGFIGNGLIARHVYQMFMGTGWKVDEVTLFDLNREDSERFASTVCLPDRHAVRICESAEELIRSSSMVVFATTAAKPHVHDLSWFSHAPVVLNLSLRDLAPEILLASNNIVDDVEHVMNADTSPHLAEQAVGSRDFVDGTVAQLVRGECELADDRPTIFSPFGMGILDIAVGKWVYDEAVRSGRAIPIDGFFSELER